MPTAVCAARIVSVAVRIQIVEGGVLIVPRGGFEARRGIVLRGSLLITLFIRIGVAVVSVIGVCRRCVVEVKKRVIAETVEQIAVTVKKIEEGISVIPI